MHLLLFFCLAAALVAVVGASPAMGSRQLRQIRPDKRVVEVPENLADPLDRWEYGWEPDAYAPAMSDITALARCLARPWEQVEEEITFPSLLNKNNECRDNWRKWKKTCAKLYVRSPDKLPVAMNEEAQYQHAEATERILLRADAYDPFWQEMEMCIAQGAKHGCKDAGKFAVSPSGKWLAHCFEATGHLLPETIVVRAAAPPAARPAGAGENGRAGAVPPTPAPAQRSRWQRAGKRPDIEGFGTAQGGARGSRATTLLMLLLSPGGGGGGRGGSGGVGLRDAVAGGMQRVRAAAEGLQPARLAQTARATAAATRLSLRHGVEVAAERVEPAELQRSLASAVAGTSSVPSPSSPLASPLSRYGAPNPLPKVMGRWRRR